MTQKEKIQKAFLLATRVKSIARALRLDASDYDVKFPLAHANELDRIADDFLKLK